MKGPTKTRSLGERLWEVQGGACFWCKAQMQRGPYRQRKRPMGWTREHLVPRAHGGKNVRNVVLAHRGCNSDRADKLIDTHTLEHGSQLYDAAQGML